jgi:phosphoserine phosphatase RsbU/P
MAVPAPSEGPAAASLVVVDPGGQRSRVEIHPLPFTIGRQADSSLIIRDSRASRNHSQIVAEGNEYVLEDCGSRHGTWVNGTRIERRLLRNSDRIEFGVPDCYQLIFVLDGVELKRLMDQMPGHDKAGQPAGVGLNLAKLRAILDLARTLQSSFSTDDVLKSVVDAALTITGAERGFLMLRHGDDLDIRVARNRRGATLDAADLRVPRHLIHRALHHRRELLSMTFDPLAADDTRPQHSVADLELRSVVCVPLVRIRSGQSGATALLSTSSETVGLIYMDSKVVTADMAGGNRELLQTLAIEASTILENARLLEEEQEKHKIEEELRLARDIQQSMLPRSLPAEGWFRACGSSLASHAVGGDYFDVTEVHPNCWSVVVADVSGKGVSSALLASLLQGALITATDLPSSLAERIRRLNHFLNDRTGGEKYATIFYALVEVNGKLHYVNAAHCPPLLVRASGEMESLETTGMPVGLIDPAEFELAEARLEPGDKVVIYSDGVTEAQNAAGEFFGKKRLRNAAAANAGASCMALHGVIQKAVKEFSAGAEQADDITLVVMEYGGAGA